MLERIEPIRSAQARGFTWHNLSQVVAKAMLLLAWALWTKVYWIYIQPSAGTGGLLDWALIAGFAIASATVPPICISSLVPNTPANMLLTKLQVRYGWPGFAFASFAAVLLTYYSFDVLMAYWASRPVIAAAGQMEIVKWAILSTLLLVGFPAWALNKMTPEQWIDSVMQAREVARIGRILELEDAVAKAMLARATALLHADVTRMTIEQRAANNSEVAAILAASERGMARALRQVGLTFRSLYGMDLAIQSDPDTEITERCRTIARLLNRAADDGERTADYILPNEYEESTASIVLHQDTETIDRAAEEVGRSGPSRAAAIDWTLIDRARSALPAVWIRRDLQIAISVEKTAALDLIRTWIAAGIAHKHDGPDYRYSFTESEI